MFDDLIEMVDAADPMLWEVDRDQLAAMYLEAEDMARYGNAAKAALARHIAERFDEPLTLDNGTVLVPTTTTKRTAFRKGELFAEVVGRFGRWLIDPESGERVQAVEPSTVERFFEPATGRTRAWFDADVDLDAFCKVERDVPTLDVVKGRRPPR